MVEGPLQVIADVPCVGCGYNLRMQPATGTCPECQKAVALTLQESSVRWGSHYLRRLGRSAVWIAITAMALPASYILLIAGALTLEYFRPAWPFEYTRYVETVVFLMFDTLILLHVIAVILSTQPPRHARRAARDWLICAGAVLFLGTFVLPTLQALLELADSRWAYYDSGLYRAMRYLLLTIPLCLTGLPLYSVFGAERIADIYRRSGMAERSGFARWSFWLFAAGTFLFASLTALLLLIDLLHWDLMMVWCDRLEIALPLLLLGSLGLAFLGMIGALIALFLFAKRMRQLAATLHGTTALTGPAPTSSPPGSPADTSPAPASLSSIPPQSSP